MNFASKDLDELRKRGITPRVQGVALPVGNIPVFRPAPQAVVRKLLGAYRSGWERDYAINLSMRQAAGEIRWWAYEKFTIKLADDSRYTPDFAIQLADGRFEFHEVKGGHGGRRQAGITKFKVAADEWSRLGAFVMVEKQAGAFVEIKRYVREAA
jgi:hypothetical protein